MNVLGKNVLIKPLESVPEKHGDFYQSSPTSVRIKIGTIHSVGNLDSSFAGFVQKGAKIHYDVSNARQIFLAGEEYFIVPQDDLLIKE